MVTTQFINNDDNFPHLEAQKLRNRILELEQINVDHKLLNGQLRQQLDDCCLIDVPNSFEGACREEALKIADIVISKQHDYGHDNILGFGDKGIVVRLWDKISRLKNLIYNVDGSSPKHESIQDTFIDVAGYAIIGLMLQKDTFQLPLQLGEKDGG